MKFFALCFFIFGLSLGCSKKEKPSSDNKVLRVMVSKSFLAKDGISKLLEDSYYKKTGIKILWLEDRGIFSVLTRLSGKKGIVAPDILMGITPEQIEILKKVALQEVITFKKKYEPEIFNVSSKLLAYNYAPVTFLKKANEQVRVLKYKTLEEFIQKEDGLLLQNKETSSLGSLFYDWALNQNLSAASLEKIKNQNISPSWSKSYGLFSQGVGNFVFTDLTSLYYHHHVEKNHDYAYVSIESGHPLHVEYMGFLNSSKKIDLFIETLFSDKIQSVWLSKNYMLPTYDYEKKDLSEQSLPRLKLLPYKSPQNKL